MVSAKDQFSDEEWFVVASLPAMIGAAMAGAGKSGIIGTAKEAMASMKSVVAGASDYPGNPIIAGILEKAESFTEAREKAGAYRDKALGQMKERNITSPEDFNTYMLSSCEQAVAMVTERCTAEEADQYRQWSRSIAEKVANAASEGGFLGFGGEQVSEGEKKLLAKIDGVLNIA